MKSFCNAWFFFKVVIPTENMFTTTLFTSIRFTFIIRYDANEQPLCESNFNLFGFFVDPIASFHETLDKIRFVISYLSK